MTENGVTKMRFDLWAVLAFLVLLGSLTMGGLYGLVATGKAERIATNYMVNDRLTRLETNYIHILEGISDLRKNQERIAEAVIERESVRRKTLKGKE